MGYFAKEIERELQERRDRAFSLSIARKQEIEEIIPQYHRLNADIWRAAKMLGQMATGKTDSCGGLTYEEVEKIIVDIGKEKIRLLVEKGYPEDYFTNVYHCNICQDTGVVPGEGRRCSCYRSLLVKHLQELSASVDPNETFDGFSLLKYPDNIDEKRYNISVSPRIHMGKVLKHCRAFAENLTDPKTKNMLFAGGAGLGKSYMANCIYNYANEKNIPALFISAPALFKSITITNSSTPEEAELSRLMQETVNSVELLIIDDLGTEKQTQHRYAELMELLNTREQNSRRFPCKTVITTNMSPGDIFSYYGERIASRLLGNFDVLLFTGEDIRLVY